MSASNNNNNINNNNNNNNNNTRAGHVPNGPPPPPPPLNQRDNRFRPQPSAPVRQFQRQEYSNEEQVRIQSMLDKVLGPEYVSFRPGGGGQKVSYIEGWRALNLANEVFGFNGWNSELISQQVDFVDTHGNTGRFSMGLSVVVRVTIRDGTYHEDFGYGYIENAKSKATAFEKCKKEAFTDGIKRCLRCFGSLLGNCLYDKTLLKQLEAVEKIGTNFEASDFYRDPMFMEKHKRKQIPSTHILEKNIQPNIQNQRSKPPVQNSTTTPINANQPQNISTINKPTKPSNVYVPTTQEAQDLEDSFLFSDEIAEEDLVFMDEDRGRVISTNGSNVANNVAAPIPTDISIITPQVPRVGAELPLFVSAKGANMLQQTPDNVANIPQFDPKFISPNMRRTVDPNRSVPVKRSDIRANGQSNSVSTPTSSTNSTSTTNTSTTTTTTSTTSSTAPTIDTTNKAPTPPLNVLSNEVGNTLGKRIGMPPSQRPAKRIHKE
ncbi:Rad52 protein [Scheffersomyces amazonensis]|uniref:Rad52 protein n=1 Tax=Scheffersomyces amazonensis TaxID=1078765 RepID=UPI00315C8154